MKKKRLWIIPLAVLVLLAVLFLGYTSQYYQADGTAERALASDDSVTVEQTDYGWFFDGPSETDALVFYPGAKVEETAYAPLLHRHIHHPVRDDEPAVEDQEQIGFHLVIEEK